MLSSKACGADMVSLDGTFEPPLCAIAQVMVNARHSVSTACYDEYSL